MKNKIKELIARCGFHECGNVNISELKYYSEVRAICEANSCRGYGATWACPPAVGTIEECKARVEQYEDMIVFTGKFELEDSFDFEGMIAGLHNFKHLVDRFQQNLTNILSDYLLLSNEGCGRCSSCTYPGSSTARLPKIKQTKRRS